MKFHRDGHQDLAQVEETAPDEKQTQGELDRRCQTAQRGGSTPVPVFRRCQTSSTQDTSGVFGDALPTKKPAALGAAGHSLTLAMVGTTPVFEGLGIHAATSPRGARSAVSNLDRRCVHRLTNPPAPNMSAATSVKN
jgi:hypothetical protein